MFVELQVWDGGDVQGPGGQLGAPADLLGRTGRRDRGNSQAPRSHVVQHAHHIQQIRVRREREHQESHVNVEVGQQSHLHVIFTHVISAGVILLIFLDSSFLFSFIQISIIIFLSSVIHFYLFPLI